MTFEDWTDVMYATRAVYWWSWSTTYLLFFSRRLLFILIIGIVIKVLEEEHRAERQLPKRVNLGA